MARCLRGLRGDGPFLGDNRILARRHLLGLSLEAMTHYGPPVYVYYWDRGTRERRRFASYGQALDFIRAMQRKDQECDVRIAHD